LLADRARQAWIATLHAAATKRRLALERVRSASGTREGDATLVRRLAVSGAQAELQAGRNRREAIEALTESTGCR
jgi:hypothetical protein